ncbi:hypothetical protein F6455_13795 [Proteobacteria bacterium 005FR1]|nr:hypothetical protein [Proteobacteria bacterium 005FR1]
MATSPYDQDPLEKRGTTINPTRSPVGAPTTERTVAAAHRSVDAVGVRASRSEERLRSAASSTMHRYTDTRDSLRDQIDSSMNMARSYVREHPIIAAGAAFAAGAILTSLLGKRR